MFYPIFIQLKDRPVLVVGGGPVAERKVDGLLTVEARVMLVSPVITEHLQRLRDDKRIRVAQRAFADSDVKGVALIISATDDPGVQQQVALAARSGNVLVNTVDQPDLCDFIVPAIVRRGDVAIAISTSGKSPVLAAALRAKLEEFITDDVSRAARLLGDIRPEIHARFSSAQDRKRVFEHILRSGFLDWLARYDDGAAMERMRQIVAEFK